MEPISPDENQAAPLPTWRAVLRGALTALVCSAAAALLSDFVGGSGWPCAMGIVLLWLAMVVPGWRDRRYRRPRALLALAAGACLAACVLGGAFVMRLANALGGAYTG